RVPMTVLAVKDRVFGHNPLAALYLANTGYYGRLMNKTDEE
ncbi:MAG: metal-binding protein, partial [Dehalococcoidia bacterium]|nr:metal-binding protein [Dehalococcoidia bacterium]